MALEDLDPKESEPSLRPLKAKRDIANTYKWSQLHPARKQTARLVTRAWTASGLSQVTAQVRSLDYSGALLMKTEAVRIGLPLQGRKVGAECRSCSSQNSGETKCNPATAILLR
jgi:hypothetical protein